MLFLFSDFGAADIYVGQMHARLRRALPAAAIVDLLHAAPAFDVRASAHLLAALSQELQEGDVCIAVVDPGVGSERDAVALHADGRWFVGPDNGLLSVVAARATRGEVFRIAWRPPQLSASFHGRDLFAPVAAQLACGDTQALQTKAKLDVEFGVQDLARIIYIDHYGNAMTGVRASGTGPRTTLIVAGADAAYARVFSAAAHDTLFWYANSLGLVELALRSASAAQRFGLRVGDAVDGFAGLVST